MALNDPERPDLARAAQDVDAAPQPEPQGPKHYGRGGAANVIGGQDEPTTAQRKSAEEAKRQDNGAGKGMLSKGKEFLEKLGKK